jgi:hypothetical protein
LKRVNNTLKQQIDAMNDPDDEDDPVIAAYEGIPIILQRTIWKYTKICHKEKPNQIPQATHLPSFSF